MKLEQLRELAAQKPILNNANMLLNHIDLLLNVAEAAKKVAQHNENPSYVAELMDALEDLEN